MLDMYAIRDLQRIVGLSDDQLRDRIAQLRPAFDESVHRGSRGRILVGDDVLAALRRKHLLEREGLSPSVAGRQVLRELPGNGGNGGSTSVDRGGGNGSSELAMLREMLDETRKDRDFWRSRALELEERLDIRAIPATTTWWRRLIGRSRAAVER